jgi:hypothetical protein
MNLGGETVAVTPVNGFLVKLVSSQKNNMSYSHELNGRHK